MYDAAILEGLFFQCAVMGMVDDSLSSSVMCESSSDDISPIMGPIRLVRVRLVVFISSILISVLLHVVGHRGRVM